MKREERAVGSAPMAAASGWRDQLSEARQRTEAAEARAEQAESEIAGWQVAGEMAKSKVRPLQASKEMLEWEVQCTRDAIKAAGVWDLVDAEFKEGRFFW